MKSNIIYVSLVAIACAVVGGLTITGVQSTRTAYNKARELQENPAVTEESGETSIENSTSDSDKSSEDETKESVMQTIDDNDAMIKAEKPVIYIYSDVDDKYIELALDTTHNITCEYPSRDENGVWKVVANTDGKIEDLDGKEYNYLYWEADSSTVDWDFSKGFCVEGKDSAEFLNKSLTELGLTRKEANEFIVYWLPRMEQNKYNLIAFQTDVYTNEFDLRVHPYCDNMLRVFMAYKSLDSHIDIEEQNLKELASNFKREGLHIVEWGGTYIK